MATHYVQSNTFYLAGSGAVAADTSVILTSFSDIYGNVLTMSDFGAIGYITLEPDTTNEEAAQFTGITANTNGTYTLTGVSTLLAVTPYTATSGLVRSHVGGTKVVVTDNVAFWNTFGNVNNTNTWADTQTFSVPAVQATNPTLSTEVANKAYVDSVAIAGAPNATTVVQGLVQLSTQAQVDAGTATGSTGASLAPTPALLRSKLLSDYVADTGAADAYVITPSPAITAYTAGQTFSFKAANTNTTASTINVNALGAKDIKKLDGATALVAGDIVAGQIIVIEYDGTNFQMVTPVANAPLLATAVKFGGTGVDGALTITSGATNIDLGSAAVVVKNYTSISITGTGSLTFTNPNNAGTVVIIKSQGNVTLTSSTAPMIDGSGLGSLGGSGGAAATSQASGSNAVTPTRLFMFAPGGGIGGINSANITTGGASGATPIWAPILTDTPLTYPNIFLGAGGGGGGASSGDANVSTGGNGGNGGGAIVLECGGALNFTTAGGISVAGKSATNGDLGTATTANAQGAGGGGGGYFVCLYNLLTAASGTVTVSGGAAGAGAAAGSPGGSYVSMQAGSGGGGISAAAANATTGSTGAVGGTAGGNGYSLIQKNSYRV